MQRLARSCGAPTGKAAPWLVRVSGEDWRGSPGLRQAGSRKEGCEGEEVGSQELNLNVFNNGSLRLLAEYDK